jgi:branched-chain amino acid transport system substrate-binding protein
MKITIRRRIGIAAVVIACAALRAPAICVADTLRIGAILSLTGNNAAQGQYVRDGIMMAVDEINRRGGVNGNKLELILADSKSDPKAAADAFQKMEAAQHPLLYVSYSTAVGTALAPLAESGSVVLVGLVTASVDFTKGREWVFRYWPLGPGYITPLLRILQDLKVRKLGIIYQNDDFGKEQQELMTKSFLEAGGSTLVQPFGVTDADVRSQIAALKDCEAIYIAGSGANLLNVTRQLRSASYRGNILMPAGGADPALFSLPEMSKVYVAAPIIHNPSYLYAREAGAQFLSRYNKPFNQWAANGYDFIKLISGLLEDRTLTRQGIREVMAGGFEYSGVFGHVRLRSGDHDLTFPMYPTQVQNGALSYR